MNPLNNTPLNTKKVFVMGTDHSGCEIYLPVDSYDELVIQTKKQELQQFLFNQPLPKKELA
jgi:hypothetical protein